MSKLGKNVTKLRKALGQSGRTLAKQVGIDHSYLSRIESGEQNQEKISYGVLKKLGKALNASVGELSGLPNYRNLERIAEMASSEDIKMFNAIVELPSSHPKRKACKDALGMRGGRSRKASSGKSRRARR